MKKEKSVCVTVEIPVPLHRKLKEEAAAKGCSLRELVLAGIESILEGVRPQPKRVRFPLVVSDGPKVVVTNEQIYQTEF